MASRKQKLKDKRSEEEKQIQQVRMAVVAVIVIILVGIGIFVAKDSGLFDSQSTSTSSNSSSSAANPQQLTGTIDQICNQATPATTPANRTFPAPDQVLENGVNYQAIMCTDVGAIYLDLFEDRTPVTVNSFVFLARNGYYNNTIFHRVIDGFMAQGGDPTGTGTGGPGYQFQNETFPDLVFDRPYLLAMANTGRPNSNGSQFFITFAPYPSLNGGYTIFGDVLAGQDAVDNIMRRDPNNTSAPATKLEMVVIVTPDDVKSS